MRAILIVSHGSHSPKTIHEVEALVRELRSRTKKDLIEYAFLEIASPSIPEGIRKCLEQGADEVFVLLNFLNSGRHVDEDIPRIVDEASREHPQVKFSISKPVGQHAGITDLFADLMND